MNTAIGISPLRSASQWVRPSWLWVLSAGRGGSPKQARQCTQLRPLRTTGAAAGADEPSGATDQNSGDIPDSVEGVLDADGGKASVTIGGETWEFELVEDVPIASCDSDFFGGFVALLMNAGASMTSPMDTVGIALPGGNFTDPPEVTINLNATSGEEWIADETIYEQNADLPAGLGVTSFSIDGSSASGTAVFFEQESFYQFNAGNGDLVVEEGTFTVTCGS